MHRLQIHAAGRVVALAIAALLVVPMVAEARDDRPDPAGRFLLTPPAGWQRVELSCGEWRYDNPQGRGALYLAVRVDLQGPETGRDAARRLAESLFGASPDEIPNPDTTYHGAPVTRLIGTLNSGSAGFTNSTSIPLADGSSLLWLEVGLLPPQVGRATEIAMAEANHVAWRSLRSSGRSKPIGCQSPVRTTVPLSETLQRWVGVPKAAPDSPPSGGYLLSDLVEAGVVSPPGPTPPPDVGGSGLGSHPYLTVHEVRVSPSVVAAGADMELLIELAVSHSGGPGELPVLMTHAIQFGDQVVYEGPAERFAVPNGRRATITKTLRAASRPGAFTIDVSLAYDSAQGGGTAAFQIR
jgi:hypothetical protein